MRRAVCFALLALVALAGVARASEMESTEELDMQLADAASAEMEALHMQQLRVNAVPLCMEARGEDVDVASLKKASGNLLKQLALVNEKLVRKPASRSLKQQQHCIREVLDFQEGVVKAIAKFGPMKVPIEKKANDVETKLLNLPCELEEGDHVEECEKLSCKVKALRAKAANVQQQAETTYRIHSLRRRVIRYEEHVKQIRETKQCPSQLGGHKKEREPVMMEFSAHTGHSAKNCPKKDPWAEHWMICLDRAEQRMQQLKSGIATLQGSVKAMEVKKFPEHCSSKKKVMTPLPRVCNAGKKQKKSEKKKEKKRAHKKVEHKNKKAHQAKKRDPPPAPAPKKKRFYQGRSHAPFQFSAAIASGDPHVDTFDRFHHDTMVAGWFTWAQNSVITVQAYSQLGCMPASIPNTCIRAVVVRIVPPDSDESLIVSYGYWGGQYQNVVVQDSHGRNVNVPHQAFKAGSFLGGKFGIAVRGNQLHIGPNGKWIKDPALAINVVIAPHLLVVTLPRAAPHMGSTNGLFGFFHAPGHKHYQSSFRMRDGSNSAVTQKSLCQRCGWGGKQQPEILAWAASHVVTGPHGANPPIGMSQSHLKQQKYLNAYHQNKRHNALVELNENIKHNSLLQLNQTLALAALQEAANEEFSPFPKKSKAVILPSFVPKVTMKNLKFCRNLIKGALKQTAEQKRASQAIPWWKSRPCVSAKQLKDIKAELAEKKKKRAAAAKKFTAALNSCLQDAANKKIAKTVATAQKTAKKAVKKCTKALVKVVKKAKAKARAKQAAKAAGKKFDAAAYNKIAGNKKPSKKSKKADTKRRMILPHMNERHRGPIGLLREGQGARDLDHELHLQEEQEARLRAEEAARRHAEADVHHVVGVRVIHHVADDHHSHRHHSSRHHADEHDSNHGRREAHHANGFWVGALSPQHTTRTYKLCPDCQPIVYNTDSPLSEHDIKLMRAQYAELVLGGVKLHSQDILDRAELMISDAELYRKKLLDQYPTSRAVVMEDAGDAESD